jgi:spore coat polysaccharide biosynthesis protein SpsF
VKTVAIIQAHMRSSRLPGKVLLDISGQTMLERVVKRVARCVEIGEVVVATSRLPVDDAVVEACRALSVRAFRGSDDDVLDRFLGAARSSGADICVRVTSDCPLIDPEVSDEIVRLFKAANPPVDYASNKIPQSWPRGLDTEVFTITALERAWEQAIRPYERTHVTVYMYEHPEQFRLLSATSEVDRSDWRWTVDTQEDLEFVRAVYDRLGADGAFGWRAVVDLLEREPELRDLNRQVTQKRVEDG